MPLARRAMKTLRQFDNSVSYRVGETDPKMRDALNVFSNQGVLETRYGYSRFNDTSLDGSILSLSFFKDEDGNTYQLAKVSDTLYKVNTTGAATSLKTGLSTTTKHRAITFNNRHIISIENDGLFSYDGTTFTQLGQAAPASFSDATSSGGSLTDTETYQAAVTFYSSTLGFESNALSGSELTMASPNLQIDLSSMPSTADNAFIDKKRIYLKNVSNATDFLFIAEIPLATTTYTIDEESTSTQTPPTTHAAPQSGGGKFLTEFNRKVVYAGNDTFKNDVYFSEQDLPDAYDDSGTGLVLNIPENGPISGIATGLYNGNALDPYLVIFKEKSTHIYSEIGGNARFVTINKEIGCVSHDSISIKNGSIYFLSERGWRVIVNGSLVSDSKGNVITLGDGDIDDIFTSKGFIYEVNRTQLNSAFSVYYPTLDMIYTWVAEGTNNDFTKIYNYEFQTGGFKPLVFELAATATCLGEDEDGNEAIIFSDANGFLYNHSIHELRRDVDADNNDVSIDAFTLLFWIPSADDGDFDATYNYRELLVRALTSDDDITVKTWINFDVSDLKDYTYSFPNPQSGFILDISKLDEGTFGDDRAIVTARADINRVGETILIGFYQNILDSNMNLLTAQLHMSKNGNRN